MSLPRKASAGRCWGALLGAALALLLSACCGYTTGPGGTTIQRVGLDGGDRGPRAAAAARPTAAPARR